MENNFKIYADGGFSDLQHLRYGLDNFNVSMPRWCGRWNGLNWERLSFLIDDEKELQKIKEFCRQFELQISFSNEE